MRGREWWEEGERRSEIMGERRSDRRSENEWYMVRRRGEKRAMVRWEMGCEVGERWWRKVEGGVVGVQIEGWKVRGGVRVGWEVVWEKDERRGGGVLVWEVLRYEVRGLVRVVWEVCCEIYVRGRWEEGEKWGEYCCDRCAERCDMRCICLIRVRYVVWGLVWGMLSVEVSVKHVVERGCYEVEWEIGYKV